MEAMTPADWDLILQALEFQRQSFASYSGYPSYEFKQERMAENRAVIQNVGEARHA